MSLMTTIATGAAPLLGGVLFGMSAKRSKPNVPDLRSIIREELELLEWLPPEQVVRRAALQHAVENHIDELVAATEQSLILRRRTRSLLEAGKWRDLALFFCVVFFAMIVWEADHERPHWLPTFIAVMLLSVVTAIFALRGFVRSIRAVLRADDDQGDSAVASSSR